MSRLIYQLVLLSFLGLPQAGYAICYHLIDPVGQVHRSRHPPYDVSYPQNNPAQQAAWRERFGYLIISYDDTACSPKHMNLKKIAKQIDDTRARLQGN